MGGSPCTLGLVVATAVLAAGCSSSPWPARQPAQSGLAVPTAGAQATAASGPQAAGGAPAAKPDTEGMQQVMAQLQELGALDPAAQATLMADLRQTDPAWWPMVVQQFQAAVAYRRRFEGRRPASAGPDESSPVRPVSATMPLEGPAGGQPGSSGAGSAHPPLPVGPPGGRATEHVARLPAAENGALAPSKAPGGEYPATPFREATPTPATPNGDVKQTAAPGGRPAGQLTSLSEPVTPGAWQTQLGGAIQGLESQLQGTSAAAGDVAEHARLRMLYLLAGRRDDAVRPIPSIPPAEQEFWSKQLYGLATWLEGQRTADTGRRAAETKQVLEEAITRLGESAPLLVRNLAFCTEVQSYGCTKPFKTYEFAPEQEILLYAEVENFTSQQTAKGFHTSLRSGYQLFDSRGQRVADHQFTTTEEYCQNPRRDFFIGYYLRLPKRIYPGKHTLQLTIEDLESHKVGQSSIELTIKEADK
jgi:hypothetical protein